MAFAIPVLRKDYILYSQQRMAPLNGNHSHNPHHHNTNTTSPHLLLTNVRRQAPSHGGKPASPHDGRQYRLADGRQRCKAASIQSSDAEKSAKSRSSPPLSLHQVMEEKANEKVDETSQRPMSLVDKNTECAEVGERDVEVDSGHGYSLDSASSCTASTASDGLDDIKTPSADFNENFTPEPHDSSVCQDDHARINVAPATTSVSLSAPPSPSLAGGGGSTPMTIRPHLRSERISIRQLENDEENGVFKDGDGNLRRHVHFGFCEQIEYEDDFGKKSSHAKRQQSALNRLKWLEAKLSCQFRNRGRLFRPRAFSNPVIRLRTNTTTEGKSTNQDSVEKQMDDLSAVFDSMGRAISAEDLTWTATKLAHQQHDRTQKRCNRDDGNLTKIGGPTQSVFRFPSFRNQQKK